MMRTFDGYTVYNMNYVAGRETPDGPMHEEKALQILARDIPEALEYIKQLEAPSEVRITAIVVAADGAEVHMADGIGLIPGL